MAKKYPSMTKKYPRPRVDPYIPDLEGEIWKTVEGFEDILLVSNLGRLKTLGREVDNQHGSLSYIEGRVLSPNPAGRTRNLLAASIRWEGKCRRINVARTVLKAFIGEPPTEEHEACHKDSNFRNNKVENLIWEVPKKICAIRDLRGVGPKGIRNGNSKLTNSEVTEIRKLAHDGISTLELSTKFKVSCTTIQLIKSRKIWKTI